MSSIEPKDICKVRVLQEPSFEEESISNSGITILPEQFNESEAPVLKPEAGPFAKWIKTNHPELDITYSAAPKLSLHSDYIWLPLVFLASDVALPVYLNLVSNYLLEKMRGGLKNQEIRVSLRAVVKDQKNKKYKEFEFEGTESALRTTIKKFDVNKFLDD